MFLHQRSSSASAIRSYREDGTPLHFTLVNLKDWCKNTFEVVNQLRINTHNGHQRYDVMGEDFRFKNYGLAPKSVADYFLLHGFHFIAKGRHNGNILPHGVLFRSGAEERIRCKLLEDGNIDTVIGLPANLFFSTGIPVCILVLKKCKKPDDVLFINASEHFEKGKRQNRLLPEHIEKIVSTYRFRTEELRYSKRVSMEEIAANNFNLNISRYITTTLPEKEIDIIAVNTDLASLKKTLSKPPRSIMRFSKRTRVACLAACQLRNTQVIGSNS